MLVDRPPTQDSGSKESFEQDKQQLVPQGSQLQETEAERTAREKAFDRDYAQAKVKWEALAKEKDWTQVKPDLSVYRYSGEDFKEDPRAGESYRDEVADQLGFGEDWRSRHAELNEAEIAAAREVVRRKAGAF